MRVVILPGCATKKKLKKICFFYLAASCPPALLQSLAHCLCRGVGRKFVISLNKYHHSSRLNVCVILVDEKGNTSHSLDSLGDCAKFLKVDPSTISRRKSKGISFRFENKTVYIKNDKVSD